MHPANHHATANAWSLRRAWAALRDTNTPDDRTPLRSPVYGVIRALGGHADPTPTAAASPNHTRLTDHTREAINHAWWLLASATRHQPATTGPTLAVITQALPHLDPRTAADISSHLADADRRIRTALRLGDDHRPIPGNPPCPACGTRLLRARTSNPDTAAWPVICATGCRCTGTGCPCRMTTPVRGVEHIWPASYGATLLEVTA